MCYVYERPEFLRGNHTLTREEQRVLLLAAGFSQAARVPIVNGTLQVSLAG